MAPLFIFFSSIFPFIFFGGTDNPVNMARQKVVGYLVPENVPLMMELELQITQNGSIPFYNLGHSCFIILFIIPDCAVFIELILWASKLKANGCNLLAVEFSVYLIIITQV